MFVSRTLRPLAARTARVAITRAISAQKSQFSSIATKSLSVNLSNKYNNQFSIRHYSVLPPNNEAEIIDYDGIKEIATSPEKFVDTVLVDVREPVEFQEGHIPGAVNIPFKSSPGALDLSAEEFKDAFGFEKPSKEQNLIFYCLGGVRSSAAAELANCFGYKKRGNYIGSWEDWIAHENKNQ